MQRTWAAYEAVVEQMETLWPNLDPELREKRAWEVAKMEVELQTESRRGRVSNGSMPSVTRI